MPFHELVDNLQFLVDFGLFLLIWLVPLIIYPSLEFTDPGRFKQWHNRYTGLITLFVMPLMFSQMAIYGWSALTRSDWQDFGGIALMALAWIATLALSVPCHDRLQKAGYDAAVIRRLIGTNWVRTAAWSAMLILDSAAPA